MININKAREILLKEKQNATIVSTGQYKDWYVFELKIPGNAIKIGEEEMEMDPYWFVNSNTSEIEHYIQVYKPEIFKDIVWTDGKLYHHGIKGQKWGVRRFQNEDGSLTAAGKERYDDNNSSSDSKEKKKFQLTDKQKKILIAGGVIAGTALLIYGSHKLGEHIANSSSTDPRLYDLYLNNNDFSKVFKKKENFDPLSMKDIDKDLKVINGGEIGHAGLKGRGSNCPNCAMAYDLRRRGLDVKAAQLDGGRTTREIENAMGRYFNKVDDSNSKKDIVNNIMSQPIGSRGFLLYKGHINNYEVFSDGVYMMDAQVGWKRNLSLSENSGWLEDRPLTGFMRTDNIQQTPYAVQYITNNTKRSLLKETLNTSSTVKVSALAGVGTYAGLSAIEAKEKDKEKSKTREKSK